MQQNIALWNAERKAKASSRNSQHSQGSNSNISSDITKNAAQLPSHVSVIGPIPRLRNGMRNTLEPLETCLKTIIKLQFNFARSLTLATYIKRTMRSAAIYF